MKELLDEKLIGIVAIAVIAIVSLAKLDEPSSIVIPCIAGIAGFVSGSVVEAIKKVN